MSEKRNHYDYLQKASAYDMLAQFYKYSNPNLHIHYYHKHMKYMRKALLMRNQPNPVQEETQVRFLHSSPDAGNIDIYVNGQPNIKNLPFKQVSNYLTLRPGRYIIEIYPAGKMTDSVLNKKITVEPGQSYTLAAIGSVNKLRLLPYLNQPKISLNEAKMRFLHLSPDSPAIDIAVKDRDIVFSNVSYKQATEYLGLMPMTVDLEIREAGGKNVLLPMPNARFNANETYTIVFLGLTSESPGLQAMIMKD